MDLKMADDNDMREIPFYNITTHEFIELLFNMERVKHCQHVSFHYVASASNNNNNNAICIAQIRRKQQMGCNNE